MTRSPTFSLSIGWQTLLNDAGLKPDLILRRARLPEDLFSRPNNGLTTDEYFRFWHALETEANDPLFPIHIAEMVSAESFDPPLFAALCSVNLMQAIQRLAKYKQLLAPMSLQIEIGKDGDLTVSPRWLVVQTNVPYSLQVAELAFFLKLARLATRTSIKARQLKLPIQPAAGYQRQYENHFGTAIHYGEYPSITFSAVDAIRPFLTVNEGMWRVFEPDLRRRLSELDISASTAERVRAVLLELLPANAATIEKAAERLGMSKRTLQRRLEADGENFRALVNSTREHLAHHYLGNTSLSSGEIAFLLGFEDPNSFYRAFQEWTGQTPETTRHALRLN